ncbi:SDR family oxidoreductase [Lysobacter korlensis]|uniref:SDR family oxidoreductase n=1 Tax=Lysobacter korlensis TaxID=553636 RepID=A0ABV6RWW2_9GAMM
MEHRVALVTGGSRGIGAAITQRLAAEGMSVLFTYRSSGTAAYEVVDEITRRGGAALAARIDSGAPGAAETAVSTAIERFGGLDVLVNNAGTFDSGELASVGLTEVDHALALHVRAPYLFSQAAARRMRDGGRIITIGSTFADRVPYAGVALYAMTKAAVGGMTRGLARDLGERGITANVVHPGNIDTDMNPASSEEAASELPQIALGQYGAPADIAGAVAFLAGPDGGYVTGATLTVDGGYNA